jgi:hypothetical protein
MGHWERRGVTESGPVTSTSPTLIFHRLTHTKIQQTDSTTTTVNSSRQTSHQQTEYTYINVDNDAPGTRVPRHYQLTQEIRTQPREMQQQCKKEHTHTHTLSLSLSALTGFLFCHQAQLV